MRTIKRVLDSTETPDYSPWVRVNHGVEDYSVGFTFHPHTGSSGTYSVQASLSNPEEFLRGSYSRTTTTLTVTLTDHGLVAGDCVNLRGTDWDQSGGKSLDIASITDADIFTVTVADTGAASGKCDVAPIRVEDLSGFSAVSGRQSGGTTAGVQLIRASVEAGSFSGKGTLEVTQSNS